MQPLRAHVHNGRLVLDEPTDLPEGEVVYLQVVDGDDMGDDEREALHGSIRESIEQMKSGQLIDADEVLAGLRVLDCGGDDLDDEERAALHSSIERGLEDVKAGRTVSARDVVEELRARATGR